MIKTTYIAFLRLGDEEEWGSREQQGQVEDVNHWYVSLMLGKSWSSNKTTLNVGDPVLDWFWNCSKWIKVSNFKLLIKFWYIWLFLLLYWHPLHISQFPSSSPGPSLSQAKPKPKPWLSSWARPCTSLLLSTDGHNRVIQSSHLLAT